MNHLVLAVTLVLMLAGAGTAWHFRQKHRHQARRTSRLQNHAERLTQQLRATEQCLGYLASTVLPAVGAAAQAGRDHGVDLVVPSQLMNTPLADRLGHLTGQLVATVDQVRTSAETEAGRHVARVQTAASRDVAQAREESQEVTRAAVRAFASTVVAMASKVSREVSQGVRRHQGDEAYATLVGIDHPAQQMLLAAQGYVVLAGGKLSRRWPTTSLTEVVRAAMGRIEGFERVQHQELDLAVDSRAVEAVVHTLAVLLDNALRYSPPAASVYVALLEGHHGTSVVVDDAGLRMSSDPVYRRKIARQLNRGESIHALRRQLHYAREGKIVRRQPEQQNEQAWCLTVVTNAVICWHTEYLGLAVGELRGAGREVDDEVLAHISPARSSAVNYYGSITVDYDRELAQLDAQGHRPLRGHGTDGPTETGQ